MDISCICELKIPSDAFLMLKSIKFYRGLSISSHGLVCTNSSGLDPLFSCKMGRGIEGHRWGNINRINRIPTVQLRDMVTFSRQLC